MFVWTFDLRMLLLIVLLLPVAGAFFALSLVRLQQRRRQVDEQVALLGALFDRAPVGLLLFGDRENLLHANGVASRFLRLPAATIELPETRWARLLRTDLHEAGRYRTVELSLAEATNGALDGADSAEMRVVRWWITHRGRLTLVLLFDITNEQRAEQSANRLLSDLSHELRTPLATLLTHLEVLALPALSEEVRAQSLHFMRDEVQRLVRMSNRTLELGQLQSSAPFEPQQVDLVAVAESVVAQMAVEAAAKDGRITLEADDSLPPVAGDPDQLRQVLLNLLDNAIKYGGNGNRIVVSLGQGGSGRGAGGVVCTVRDGGPGIAPEHLPHLERRFYRGAPSNVAGSGLGLSMVREILRRHNSQLELSSQTAGDERGTTARFVLPLFGAADFAGVLPAAASLAGKKGRGKP